jgi:hypothetical protein
MATKTETSNKAKMALLKALKKREQEEVYKNDFELFAKERIRILPKDSNLGYIPMHFNAAQRLINKKIEEQLKKTGRVRAIILKARQQGISTYTCGRVFWKCYFRALQKSVVMAHDAATSDALFTMSKAVINNMEDEWKPEIKRSNTKEIQFEHNESGYRLYTAGSPEAGRGTTPTVAHLSEVAFWQHDDKILAGLFQGISQADGTEVILESTANGVGNEFHRLWCGAVAGENEYLPIFIPWFLTPEYERTAPEGFERTADEQAYSLKIYEKHQFAITDAQLYWRRLKIAEGGEDKFKQEYPAHAEEAFLVSGSNVFNLEKLNELVPQPILFTQEFNFEKAQWEDARAGSLEIYKTPQFNDLFVIAADVALGVGKDYSSAVVLNSKRQVCAVYRNNLVDPTKFGDLLFYLGRYYNNALLGVESNSMGIATLNRLIQMNYQNIYYQVKAANSIRQDEEGLKPGWRTTHTSKPSIIGYLKNAIEEDEIWIPSRVMISELMTYVADTTGKTNAQSGSNDDTVMALAIGLEILRTHGDKLTNTKIGFREKNLAWRQPETVWL